MNEQFISYCLLAFALQRAQARSVSSSCPSGHRGLDFIASSVHVPVTCSARAQPSVLPSVADVQQATNITELPDITHSSY